MAQIESTASFECACGRQYEIRLRRAVGADSARTFHTEEQRDPVPEGRMNFFRQRRVQAAAYEWKREREWQLRTEIKTEAALLRDLRTQWAEFRQLEGEQLALRFLCETPEEMERTIRGKRTWLEEVKALWCWGKHPENMAKAA